MPALTVDVADAVAEALSKVGPTPEEALRRILESWGQGYVQWEASQARIREHRALMSGSDEAYGSGPPADDPAANPRAAGVVGQLQSGVRALRQDAPEEGIDALRRAAELSPENPGAWMTLGLALRAQGDLAGAADSYHQALDLSPDYATAWTTLGEILKRMAKVEDALAALRKALALDDMEGHAVVILADILAEQGDVTGATDELWAFVRLAQCERKELDHWITVAQERMRALGADADDAPTGP